MKDNNTYEVAIIGGSYAGLSAALILGRSLRNVLVIDKPKPRNISAKHAHGLFSRDGESPETILLASNKELMKYKSVKFLSDQVIDLQKIDERNFVIKTPDQIIHSKCVILATGVTDILPDIEGSKALWGSFVFHCPYCQGWEVKNQKLALIATRDLTVNYIKLIHLWTRNLTVFTNGINFSEEELFNLKKLEINVIDGPVHKISRINSFKCEIQYGTGKEFFQAVFVRPIISYNNALALGAGCAVGEFGELIVDSSQQTTIPGIYAVGDLANLPSHHKLAVASASGTKAGLAINSFLLEESFQEATSD